MLVQREIYIHGTILVYMNNIIVVQADLEEYMPLEAVGS